ncbi:TRAP transporter small permease [Polycladidibacter hongkongensis]|uniref:TRAP transporter small permease n=1 Tax=Polycladidibacter hongkongensis TaxID=1647556 RepID=UPI0009EBA498|nr:TRAP transporter small permease [Pseudovibrio hongkongensis]
MTNLTDELPGGAAGPLERVLKLMQALVIAGGVVMALTFSFVVVFRYGFNANLFAYEEWLMAASFWVFFIGAALASAQKAHINADILGFLITNPRVIWWRELVVETIEILVLLLVCYWAYLMIAEEIGTYPLWQTTNALKIPFLVPRLGIFVGYICMTAFAILHFYLLIRKGPGWADHHEELEHPPVEDIALIDEGKGK